MEYNFTRELFSKTALLKAAYCFTDKACIHLDMIGKDSLVSIDVYSD